MCILWTVSVKKGRGEERGREGYGYWNASGLYEAKDFIIKEQV